MSTFMKRNALFAAQRCSVFWAVSHAPNSWQLRDTSEHEQTSAESAAPDAGQACRSIDKARPLASRWPGAMDHEGMNHDDYGAREEYG